MRFNFGGCCFLKNSLFKKCMNYKYIHRALMAHSFWIEEPWPVYVSELLHSGQVGKMAKAESCSYCILYKEILFTISQSRIT